MVTSAMTVVCTAVDTYRLGTTCVARAAVFLAFGGRGVRVVTRVEAETTVEVTIKAVVEEEIPPVASHAVYCSQ